MFNTQARDDISVDVIIDDVNECWITQRAVDSSGVSRIEKRIFRQNGQLMDLIHTIPGKPKIKSVRVYKKISS